MKFDEFNHLRSANSGKGCSLIEPSDTVNLQHPTEGEHIALALYIVGDGDIKIMCPDGTIDTLPVTGTTFLQIPIKRVYVTGTTAELEIHAIW